MQRKSSKSYEESLNTDFYKVNITDVAKVELYEIYFYISYKEVVIFRIVYAKSNYLSRQNHFSTINPIMLPIFNFLTVLFATKLTVPSVWSFNVKITSPKFVAFIYRCIYCFW